MKNRSAVILVIITCCFVCFLLGYCLGLRSSTHSTTISLLPEATSEVVALAASEPTADPTVATAEPAQTQPQFPININTATAEQLDALPGIGPVLSQRIVDYREAHGPFVSVGQLTCVEGIGEKKLQQILDLITTE